jgi:hypothetical protein
MADDLQTIVQRMINAGESEANIATVIQHFKAQQSAAPATDVRSRPLLTGLTDAGAARQFSDPSAMQDLNAAKDTAANAGIGTGLAALGGTAAYGAAPGLVEGVGKGLVAGGVYKAGRAMGISPEIMAAVAAATGLSNWRGGASAPEEPAPSPNLGGRLVTIKAPSVEQQMADALQELRQPAKSPVGTTPPQAQLPAGYTPRTSAPLRIVKATADPTLPAEFTAVGAEPAAPGPPTFPDAQAGIYQRVLQQGGRTPSASAIPSMESLPSMSALKELTPADIPRSWHAFLDPAARSSADPATLSQASRLHQDINELDAAYKARTADTAAQLRANPQTAKDALLALLTGGGS